jgi:dTDP-4-dehydrorhamnose reductase
MKWVLVTGANGQLGLAIKAATAAYPELSFVFTDKSDLDITSPGQIEAFFNTNTVDVCINVGPIPTWTKPKMSQKQHIY